LCQFFSPPFHFHLYCLFCLSPSLSCIIFQFHHLFLLFPFSLFPAISYRSFSALLYYSDIFPPPPPLPRFSTERLHPLSEFQCYWIVHFSHLPPLDFLLSFIPQYYAFLVSQLCMWYF
jgi:hypothetical protein